MQVQERKTHLNPAGQIIIGKLYVSSYSNKNYNYQRIMVGSINQIDVEQFPYSDVKWNIYDPLIPKSFSIYSQTSIFIKVDNNPDNFFDQLQNFQGSSNLGPKNKIPFHPSSKFTKQKQQIPCQHWKKPETEEEELKQRNDLLESFLKLQEEEIWEQAKLFFARDDLFVKKSAKNIISTGDKNLQKLIQVDKKMSQLKHKKRKAQKESKEHAAMMSRISKILRKKEREFSKNQISLMKMKNQPSRTNLSTPDIPDALCREFPLKLVSNNQNSFLDIYFNFLKNSDPLVEKFQQLAWPDRKQVYRFFKDGSLYKKNTQNIRIWFEYLSDKMRRVPPKINERKMEKRVQTTQILNEIADESWGYEKFCLYYYPLEFEMARYYSTLKPDERKNLFEYFEKGSKEEALFTTFSSWYQDILEEFKKFDREQIPKERYLQEKLRLKQAQQEHKKVVADLKLSLLQIQPLKSVEDYENYANANYRHEYQIKKIYETLCASQQERILNFFKKGEEYKDQMNRALWIWYKDVSKQLESKRIGYFKACWRGTFKIWRDFTAKITKKDPQGEDNDEQRRKLSSHPKEQ